MPEARRVAVAALAAYDLEVSRLTFAARSYNSVFRVTTNRGLFALRVGPPGLLHPAGTAEAEARWTRRLAEAGIAVPRIIATRRGEPAATVPDESGVARCCVLSTWIRGRSLQSRLTVGRAAALGRLTASLHENATGWSPQPPVDILVADRVLYWPLPNDLLDAVGPRHRAMFAAALARAQETVDRLWAQPAHAPHVLHGDLTPRNVVVASDGGLVPIDFQDLVTGFDVQDIAITITALRNLPAAAAITDAFERGYASIRRWPDLPPDRLEALVVARRLNQMNLTLPHLADTTERAGYLDARARVVADWLRTSGTG